MCQQCNMQKNSGRVFCIFCNEFLYGSKKVPNASNVASEGTTETKEPAYETDDYKSDYLNMYSKKDEGKEEVFKARVFGVLAGLLLFLIPPLAIPFGAICLIYTKKAEEKRDTDTDEKWNKGIKNLKRAGYFDIVFGVIGTLYSIYIILSVGPEVLLLINLITRFF